MHAIRTASDSLHHRNILRQNIGYNIPGFSSTLMNNSRLEIRHLPPGHAPRHEFCHWQDYYPVSPTHFGQQRLRCPDGPYPWKSVSAIPDIWFLSILQS